MRFLFSAVLLLAAPMSAFSQASSGKSYTLEMTFWHTQLSTRDSLYTQDVDLPDQKTSIPLHLSEADFQYLDSVSTAIGFWTLPDTIRTRSSGNSGAEFQGEFTFATKSPTEFYLATPRQTKHVIVLSWPGDARTVETIRNFEMAVRAVLERQPYYNTLPDRPIRQ